MYYIFKVKFYFLKDCQFLNVRNHNLENLSNPTVLGIYLDLVYNQHPQLPQEPRTKSWMLELMGALHYRNKTSYDDNANCKKYPKSTFPISWSSSISWRRFSFSAFWTLISCCRNSFPTSITKF